ncbi:hypothetical protein DL771_011898 [Monosporascus sp. 5C6A]|nr:hypothetical protein DL771_011898 [Monosporascus sp. 5C6A]
MANDDRRGEAANPSDCPSSTSRSPLIETPEEKQPAAKRSQVQLATRVQALTLHGVGIPFAQITEKTGYSRSGFYELRRKAIQRGYVDGGPILDEHVADGKREVPSRPESELAHVQHRSEFVNFWSIAPESLVGWRIQWHRALPEQFLAFCEGTWDFTVLSHGRVKGQCVAQYALHATVRAATPHVLAVLGRVMVGSYKSYSDENVRTAAGLSFIKASVERADWTLPEETNIVPAPELLDGSWETGTVVSRYFEEEIE